MSDKPLVQQALATELAEIILAITSPASSLAFLRGFWEATVREWTGIDRLRCTILTLAFATLTKAGSTSIICLFDVSSMHPSDYSFAKNGKKVYAKSTILS